VVRKSEVTGTNASGHQEGFDLGFLPKKLASATPIAAPMAVQLARLPVAEPMATPMPTPSAMATPGVARRMVPSNGSRFETLILFLLM
jgi:hypothetical protein